MKSFVLFFRCVEEKIKNKFFIDKNHTIEIACSQWQKYTEEKGSSDDQTGIEEYLKNYQVITRWQTL